MLALRWFLSHLTFFIVTSAFIYVIFNLTLSLNSDNAVELKHIEPIEKVKNNKVSENTDKLDSLTSSPLKQEELKHEVPEQEILKQQPQKQKIPDQKMLKQEVPEPEILQQESIKQEVSKQKTLKQKVSEQENSEQENLIKQNPISPIKIVKYNSEQLQKLESIKKEASIDDLVSLLMSSNHLFNKDILENSENKTDIEKQWALARKYFKSKDYNRSEQHYLKLIKLEPSYTDFYGELSNLYFVKNEIIKYNQTLESLTYLYVENKNKNMAYYTIGLIEKNSISLANKLKQQLLIKFRNNK